MIRNGEKSDTLVTVLVVHKSVVDNRSHPRTQDCSKMSVRQYGDFKLVPRHYTVSEYYNIQNGKT